MSNDLRRVGARSYYTMNAAFGKVIVEEGPGRKKLFAFVVVPLVVSRRLKCTPVLMC